MKNNRFNDQQLFQTKSCFFIERRKYAVKAFIVCVLLVVCCISFSGCAVVMAVRQPDRKDLASVQVGALRNNVIADLGAPAVSNIDAKGNKEDVFQFRQGYGTGVKATRALIHGVADVLTLGLWEVVGTPTEAIFSGKAMAIKVAYDKDDKVKDVTYLKGK